MVIEESALSDTSESSDPTGSANTRPECSDDRDRSPNVSMLPGVGTPRVFDGYTCTFTADLPGCLEFSLHDGQRVSGRTSVVVRLAVGNDF